VHQFADLLRAQLAGIVELSDAQVKLLSKHYGLLVRWNSRLNLTSIRNLEDAVVRHYCESLFFAHHLPVSATSILDFGSGAGFPGIPLAILRPPIAVTLAESHQRKAVFLRESSRELANVSVSSGRAEDVPGPFDWVVSRAVDPDAVLNGAGHLAPNVGLMVGRVDGEKLQERSGFILSRAVPLPWGENRICIYGCFT
jgi:16S rRNA (guanine527-N7)-methyltransferase